MGEAMREECTTNRVRSVANWMVNWLVHRMIGIAPRTSDGSVHRWAVPSCRSAKTGSPESSRTASLPTRMQGKRLFDSRLER